MLIETVIFILGVCSGACMMLCQRRKKYDTFAHATLHLSFRGDPSWCNFGDWRDVETDFSSHCERFVRRLIPETRPTSILDIGNGAGTAQDAFVRKICPHATYVGLDPARGGEKEAFERFYVDHRDQYQLVMSADALYHVPMDREELYSALCQLTQPGGSVAFTDLVCSTNDGLWLIAVLARLFGAPRLSNVVQMTEMEGAMEEAGFQDVSIQDITQDTLIPFLAFVRKHLERFSPVLAGSLVFQYTLFAWIIDLALNRTSMRYILIQAKKPL